MFASVKQKFTEKPMLYYALSVCATWAGIGSLMNGVAMTQTYGVIPSLIWVLGNTVACILFGLIATKVPKVREVFVSKIMLWICGIMCVFQSWLSMNGTQTVFADTPIGTTGGTIVAYALAVFFLLLLLKFGMIRNVLTDGFGWIIVYLLAAGVTIAAMVHSRNSLNVIPLGLEPENMKAGIWKAILLLPGPFTYPYFFEILKYNDENDDGAKKINVRRSFTLGGIFFGVYMAIIWKAPRAGSQCRARGALAYLDPSRRDGHVDAHGIGSDLFCGRRNPRGYHLAHRRKDKGGGAGMKVTVKKLSELRMMEKNVRRHTDKQLKEYVRSVEMFGQIRPIVVDETGMIIAGNGLYSALQAMGRENCDCYVISGMTEAEKKKLMLADNRVYELGITDTTIFDEIIKDLNGDIDVPGWDADLLEMLNASISDTNDMVENYGVYTPEEVEAVSSVDRIDHSEQPAPAAPAPGRESEHQPVSTQRTVVCPKCGELICL